MIEETMNMAMYIYIICIHYDHYDFSVIQDTKDNKRQFLLISISTHGGELATGDGSNGDLYEHNVLFSDGLMSTQKILDKLDDKQLENVIKIVLIAVSVTIDR